MPSFDDRPRSQSSPFSELGRPVRSLGLLTAENTSTTSLPAAGRSELSGSETEETAILPAQPSPLLPVPVPEGRFILQPAPVLTCPPTRTLPDATEAGEKRTPVVIKGQKRQAPVVSHTPHHRRSLYVTLAGLFSLVLITGFTLLTVSPLGHDLSQTFSAPQTPGVNIVNSQSNDPSLVAQATATAVYHRQTDGFDPNATGSQTITNGSGSLNWPLGQCTYWANLRYHELTGYWVAWTGNADQWYAGANAAGWNVSTSPHVPSIIVLMPGVQGASSYGHVAVVESIVGDSSTPTTTPTPSVTTVRTSNMNWWTAGGGWDIESYFDFTVGPGVYFVWHS